MLLYYHNHTSMYKGLSYIHTGAFNVFWILEELPQGLWQAVPL